MSSLLLVVGLGGAAEGLGFCAGYFLRGGPGGVEASVDGVDAMDVGTTDATVEAPGAADDAPGALVSGGSDGVVRGSEGQSHTAVTAVATAMSAPVMTTT
jgi:hypothetical protein